MLIKQALCMSILIKPWAMLIAPKSYHTRSCYELCSCHVFDCTSNVHSSGAALLCCWTDIGRKEKQAGPILGWSHPLPTRSFLAGNVQAWMGVKCTPLVLVLHVIVHNLHLNKWCDQLLSIRRSWSLKIPLWRFGICTYCAGSSTCGGESFDNIQCVQKSPQFGPFPKKHQFLRRLLTLIGWIILLWHGHWSYFKHSLWYGHSSWHEHSSCYDMIWVSILTFLGYEHSS